MPDYIFIFEFGDQSEFPALGVKKRFASILKWSPER
jgi:hypothetical protein